MTSRDLLIFVKNAMGVGGRNPAWVGWENMKIYVNARFMREK